VKRGDRSARGAVSGTLPPPTPFLFLFAAALLAVATPGSAVAEYRGSSFWIERPRLALDFSYDFEEERRGGPFAEARNRSHALKERADLETSGWGYHPAFLEYTLLLSPEWEQEIEAPDPGNRSRSDSFLMGYSADATLFPRKPVTLRFFGRKDETVVTTSLAARSKSEGNTYGATANFKYRFLPATLSYTHGEIAQSGFTDSHERRDELRMNARHEQKSNDTTVDAVYTENDRTEQGRTIGTRNWNAGAQNAYRVTPDRRVSLSSSLRYRRSESELLASSGISLSESLLWSHAKNLSTNYNVSFASDASGDTRIDTTSGSAGLSHRLYENLTTSLSAGAGHSSTGDDRYDGGIGLDYQRRITGGAIFASTSHNVSVTKRSSGAIYLPVVDESRVLVTGEVTLLANRNIVLSSIVVTSADHAVIYLPDTDYRIELLGSSVRISRTPFGAIAEGGAVLVNYTYLSNPAYDGATYSRSFGAGLSLGSAWRISYRESRSRESFLSGIRPDLLGENRTRTLDTDLSWRWTTTRFTWEDAEANTGVSLTRWRASEDLLFRPRYALSLSFSGHYGETRLKETGTGESFFGFGSRLQWGGSRWTRYGIEGAYERTDGSSNKTVDRGAAARMEWFYGIWSGEFSYRFLNEEDRIGGQTRSIHSAMAAVKRTLF